MTDNPPKDFLASHRARRQITGISGKTHREVPTISLSFAA
jgi:hypothetical protein